MKIKAPFRIRLEQFTKNLTIVDVSAFKGDDYYWQNSLLFPLQESSDAVPDATGFSDVPSGDPAGGRNS